MSAEHKTRIDSEDVKLAVASALGTDIKIIDHWVEPYSKVKHGILASHYELAVIVEGIQNNEEVQKHTFFVKSSGDLGVQSSTPSFADQITFIEEVHYFNEIYPIVKNVMKTELCLPKCWLAKKNMLIFEDLRAQGFTMPQSLFFHKELLSNAASILAKFHASSILIEAHLKMPLNEVYPNALQEKLYSPEANLWPMVVTSTETMSLMADYFGLTVASADKVENWLVENIKATNSKLNVICHGDIWRNNFMIKNDKCIMIDYQLLRYCSLGVDLAMLLYITCSLELRKSSEREIIQFYYETLRETLEDSELDVKIPLFEEIWSAYNEKKLFGAVYAASYFPGLMLPPVIFEDLINNATELERYLMENRIEVILPIIKKDPKYEDKMREITEEYIKQVNKILG